MIKKMFKSLSKIFHRVFIFTLSFVTSITLLGYPAFAAKSNMTGDYTKDTVSVVKTLKGVIDTPKDAPNKEEMREEALSVITDYISRYRNRGMVNTTQSFTTMQTALNAMAGHYKNFAARPLPDNLKERLNKELSIAEKMVLRES